jgi:hypothetical protein
VFASAERVSLSLGERAGVRGKGRYCVAPVPSSPLDLIFTHF